ncbi:hypothetical protein PSHT_14546 [Puccinia striiformis]|uniref:Uncharacterized protein n=1 Tax=Puccinia striiformis TaxID=27350 RepID=A0A2S4UK25_9BASI|nr:hypothetical protein H4Q26_012855 [Puccinia striiformis f. sp. tritici PST-130]POV97484.1 hypothetical protein PSHT_14546 [Puccinia striiformis]
MADRQTSTTDSTHGADLVLAELEILYKKCNRPMEEVTCTGEEEFSEDDLEKREKLMDQLQPSLLAVKYQLTQLLDALDLRHSPENPKPNFERTLEVIANIDRFLGETIEIIESVTIRAPVPHQTHDHHLKGCKYFRSHGLRVDIHRLGSHMYSLSWYCIYFINAWKLSNRHPNSLTYRSTTTARGGDLAMNAAYCIGLSTVIIRKSEASDFSILQKEWAKIVTHLDRLLQLLIDLSYYTYDNRTLYNHISNTTTKKILFTLDSEINSETLSLLYTRSAAIRIQLENHVDILLESYEENRMGESRAEIRDLINQIARTVESTVVLLALYIIPLSPKVNRMSLQSDFKTWLFVWEGLWHTAKNNFLDALASSA